MLFGTDLANQMLPSGFPVATSPAKDKDKYIQYVESGWNLNNTPVLYGSLLQFGCYNSSAISVPQMFIGMCFASQCWVIFSFSQHLLAVVSFDNAYSSSNIIYSFTLFFIFST